MAANEKANMKLAKDMYRWFNQGEFDKLAENTASDIDLENVALGVTDHGRDTYINTLQSLKRAYSDMQVEVTHQTATGDTVVNEFHCTGTHDGPLVTPMGQEIAPTGRRVDLTICEVWEFKGGKLAQVRGYADSGKAMQQLGLMPEPTPRPTI
jgi:predicted ester cyclase